MPTIPNSFKRQIKLESDQACKYKSLMLSNSKYDCTKLVAGDFANVCLQSVRTRFLTGLDVVTDIFWIPMSPLHLKLHTCNILARWKHNKLLPVYSSPQTIKVVESSVYLTKRRLAMLLTELIEERATQERSYSETH